MTPKTIRVLVVGGQADQAERMLIELGRAGYDPLAERVETAARFRAVASGGAWDVILCDDSLPEFDVPQALDILRQSGADVPLIVVSGATGGERAVELMRAGAADYLTEDRLVRLAPAVEREVREAEARRGRQLADSYRRFEQTLDAVSDLLVAFDRGWNYTFLNRRAAAFTGHEPGELVGRNVWELFPAAVGGTFHAELLAAAASGTVRRFEAFYPESGRWCEHRAYPHRDGLSLATTDITERKRAEERLARDALLLANVRDAMIVTDPDGVVTYWNDGATRLFGWSAGEMVGRPLTDRYPESARSAVADEIRKLLDGGEWAGEFEDWRKDGSRVWIDARVGRITDAAGTVLGVLGLSHDITPRKRAEEDARRAASLLRAISDGTPDAVFVKDAAGKYLLFNPAAARFVGKPAAEVLGRDDTALFGPADARRIRDRDRRVMESGEAETDEEELTAAGVARVYLATKAPYRDEHGRVIGVIGISRDVTDRKRAEDALREKEARLADAVRVARMGYWNRDLATGDLDWSDELYDVFGVDPAGFSRTLESFLACVVPDDRQAVLEEIVRAEGSGGSFDHTYRVLARGEVRVIHEIGRATLPGGGRPGRVTGTAQDVTARERAEAELRASEDRYRTLLERIPEPLFVYDRETLGYLAVNDAAVACYGYSRDEFLGMTIKDIRPAGDVPALLDMLARSAGGFEDRGRWRHRKRDGTVFDVEITAHDLSVDGRPACIVLARDVTARLLAEQELHLRDRAIQAVVGGLLIADAARPDHPIIYTSPGFERLTGYTAAEVVGRNCRFLQGAGTDPLTVAAIRAAVGAGLDCSVELLNYRKDGTAFWNGLSISPVRNDGGELTHFIGVQTDVTGRRKLEDQFHQAQKMEAVGQLAGGVAHDFNNLLTVINGYGEIVHAALPPGHPNRELVAEITRAGERAAGLTRQLLAFSRQTVLEPKVLDPNALVRDVERLLRRLIGEDIDLATRLAPDVGRVRADPGQLEQAVVNLCVNARDAMPTGGKLTVETGEAELNDAYAAAHPDVRPGPYVLVAVADTGVGMTPEVQARVFEPFFTTKGPGKGTGLGLAMVFGFVKQSGGHVAVYSEPGKGTTFKLYLPRVADAPLAGKSAVRRTPMPRGTETVLLVEDEDAVRALGRHVLVMCGYAVLEAGNGREAVRVADGHAGPLHILVTDVVMPGGMGGRQVAEAVVARHPGAKVLFTSGYTDDAVVRHGVLEEGTHFLQKPFTPAALAQKVRDVLDGKG